MPQYVSFLIPDLPSVEFGPGLNFKTKTSYNVFLEYKYLEMIVPRA